MPKQQLSFILLFLFSVSLAHAQLRINEVMLNPATDPVDPQFQTLSNCNATTDGSEWIELFNESQCDTLDLSCFVVAGQYAAGNGGAFAFPAGTKLAPLDFLILGGPNVSQADYNLPDFCNTDNFCSAGEWNLPNDAGWVAVYDNNLDVVDAVFWTASPGQANTLISNQVFGYSPCVPTQCQNNANLESASDMTPGNEILYAGQAPANGQVIYRTTDGSGNWQSNGTPSLNDCNGTCLPASDLRVVVDIARDATCEEENGFLAVSATGGTPAYTFEWNNGDFTDSLLDLTAGKYVVTLTDADDCTVSASIEVDNIGTALIAEILPTDTAVLNGDSVRLIIESNNTIFEAIWDPFIYLSCGLCDDPVSSPEETTEYQVQLEDGNGCTATASATVRVIPDENSVFVPSAFTPNNDGLNDILFVRSPRLKSMTFEVFDRWGKIVFTSTDPDDGWDGNYNNGSKANEGVYFYIVDAELINGKSKIFKGNVTLLR